MANTDATLRFENAKLSAEVESCQEELTELKARLSVCVDNFADAEATANRLQAENVKLKKRLASIADALLNE